MTYVLLIVFCMHIEETKETMLVKIKFCWCYLKIEIEWHFVEYFAASGGNVSCLCVCFQVVSSRLESGAAGRLCAARPLKLILQLNGVTEVMGQEITVDEGQELGAGWGAVEDLEEEPDPLAFRMGCRGGSGGGSRSTHFPSLLLLCRADLGWRSAFKWGTRNGSRPCRRAAAGARRRMFAPLRRGRSRRAWHGDG